jgi:hypothetical protein
VTATHQTCGPMDGFIFSCVCYAADWPLSIYIEGLSIMNTLEWEFFYNNSCDMLSAI